MTADNKPTLPQVIAQLSAQESNEELLKSITPAPPATIDVNAGQYPTVDPMERPLWEIDNRFFNPYKEIPQILAWGKICGQPTLPKKGIVTVSAKDKEGKSAGVYAMMCALISGKPFGAFEPQETPRLVLVFDVEMGDNSLALRTHGVLNTVGGEAAKRFIIAPMMATPHEERFNYMMGIIKQYKPDIVVIDTATNFVADYNDIKETGPFAARINGELANNCTVITIIHENKSAEDKNMAGHLGTALARYQSEAYKANCDHGVFSMTVWKTRDWENKEGKFSYIIGEDGRFTDGSEREEERREQVRAEMREEFSALLDDAEEMSRPDLLKLYMEEHQCSENTAEKRIKEAANLGVISKRKDARQRVFYSIPL